MSSAKWAMMPSRSMKSRRPNSVGRTDVGIRRGSAPPEIPKAAVGLPDLDDMLRGIYVWANGMP
jgi:hypothetical protein